MCSADVQLTRGQKKISKCIGCKLMIVQVILISKGGGAGWIAICQTHWVGACRQSEREKEGPIMAANKS